MSSSAEVAADFEESLRDLQINNRYEISNLTIIAKENTEHAQAISRALESHIKTTSPNRKLPALFVLDSIVKNVGTPYTVYLGRSLFSTFMNAYTLVDSNTRRNMEGMLKTWKDRVPGSLDPRPVFPVETVRPIETALLKAKTAAIQSQRHVQPQGAIRGTATPPQHNGQFAPPPGQFTQQPFMMSGHQQPIPHQQHNPYVSPPQPSFQEIAVVKRDIELLIQAFQQQSSQNPQDARLRQQLVALNALHDFLNNKTVSVGDFQGIKAQVSSMSAAIPPPQQHTPQPAPQWQPPHQYPQQYQPPHCAQLPSQPFPPQPLAPLAHVSNPLDGLQALLANAQKPGTPQLRNAMPTFRDASHNQLHAIQDHAAVPSVNGAADLISSLTKAGLINLGQNSTPLPPSAPPAPIAPPLDAGASLLKSLQSVLPQPYAGIPSHAQSLSASSGAQASISAAPLKTFRPELVHAIYDGRPNQCSTCGRRFLATDEGRENKSRHLDWHFRTNQRIADPNLNRGHHRNWYSDEMDWIVHTDIDPSTTTITSGDVDAAVKAKKGPQDQVVRAPAGMTKNSCNICFEEMKSSYSEDLQDWIFVNATVYLGKIVHATCLAEMVNSQMLSSAGSKERSGTPDSLKRKAESCLNGGGARLRTE